jgi:hypothetical protein
VPIITPGSGGGGGGAISGVTVTGTAAAGNIIVASSSSAGAWAAPLGLPSLIYRYTVAGSAKLNIDTGVDTPDAGSNNWANGDVLEAWITTQSTTAAAAASLFITFNNDTSSNYYDQVVSGVSTTAAAGTSLARANMIVATHGNAGSTVFPGIVRLTIPAYAQTVFGKVIEVAAAVSDATAGNNGINVYAYGYALTPAITRMKVAESAGANLAVGSQLLIYKRQAA